MTGQVTTAGEGVATGDVVLVSLRSRAVRRPKIWASEGWAAHRMARTDSTSRADRWDAMA